MLGHSTLCWNVPVGHVTILSMPGLSQGRALRVLKHPVIIRITGDTEANIQGIQTGVQSKNVRTAHT